MEDSNKTEIAKREEKILKFWKEGDFFKKSVDRDAPNGEYVFYDGPPFATGLPHYGHLVPGTIKDIIPRYQTMNGKRVVRKWGWDCHGLPIEKLIQEENNLKTKEDIEEFGVEKFNAEAKASVFKYDKEWKDIIPRTGRWVDMENSYTTMDPKFTESVWWMFGELYNKGLVYEGFKSMHVSPLLETALSNFEVNLGYKDITDISVTAKFELLEEQNTFVLAWTTTPWTLPGNAALAVNEDVEYAKVKAPGGKYIVAKELVGKVFEEEVEILETFKGSELVGKEYRPVFKYYSEQEDLENKENGWKIYAASFVEVGEGTGVVHIAPAFGDEDLGLGQENNIPIISHVHMNGRFKDEVTDFAGMEVKPKDDHQKTDIEIIKHLAHKGSLFSKKKIVHSYPHCWRTDAPLINYAMSSWFIKVTDLKDKLVAANNKIKWVPENVGKSRFGNWLKEAKDWSISRSRYWGTPIPIWKSEEGDVKVLSSLESIKEKTRSTNKYFVMRHGQAESNVKETVSSDNSIVSNLTEQGAKEATACASGLRSNKPDVIITSPLLRTHATAKLVADELGISHDNIVVDKRIQETQVGDSFNGKTIHEYRKYFSNQKEKFFKTPPGGENLSDVRKRVGDFIYDIDSAYENKTILIVTHEYVVWMLEAIKDGLNVNEAVEIKEGNDDFVATGHFKTYDFAKIPHNRDFELDFHRPYIDNITFKEDGKTYKRIEDVLDTWVDSGSVPFASNGYPKNNKTFDIGGWFKKSKGFPADFISEAVDQTRGWFYTLMVINTALFGKAPFKSVVVNGLVLAEDGRKMSKSLKNYPDINIVLDKYGADALRFFLMNSQVVKGEELKFSEKGVDDVVKKIINRLDNVYTFYSMYTNTSVIGNDRSNNVLDKWIIARLRETRNQVTKALDNLEIDKATKPFVLFIDDLSTWYIRRSRDTFKGESFERELALSTTKFVLGELSKLLAPFMPFVSENIYQTVNNLNFEYLDKSVHLDKWPQTESINEAVLKEMKEVRDIVNISLEARSSVGIKVRQPIQKITVKGNKMSDDLLDIIKDEVNVKQVIFKEEQEDKVVLDTELSPRLLEEGAVREVIRLIQSLRKNAELNPADKVGIVVGAQGNVKEMFEKNKKEIMETTNVLNVKYEENDGQKVKVLNTEIGIKIEE
ncbi:MAG: isoleucyl-tRNA synthetase [Candidatus Paceibacteria bacterium]|jgi:isoleucyl-tRNA synthetase